MRRYILTFLLALTLDAKIVVVTHKSSNIEHLSKEIVQYLYLAKINKYNDIKIEPLLSDDENLHNGFCQGILCKTPSQFESYRARLVFSGKKPISKKYALEDITKKLQNPNTIAYIDEKDIRDEWKVVYEEN